MKIFILIAMGAILVPYAIKPRAWLFVVEVVLGAALIAMELGGWTG